MVRFFARRRPLTILLIVLVAVAVILIGIAAFFVERAAVAGRAGENALLQAVKDVESGSRSAGITRAQIDAASRQVAASMQDFDTMRRDLNRGGPALTVARYLPFVRVQVRAADTLSDTGQELAASAKELVRTAQQFVEPANPNQPLSDPVKELVPLEGAAATALDSLYAAAGQVASLSNDRLLGPLSSARAALDQHRPRLITRATNADQALRAFIVFAGGAGPRRYLLLSQNPDEVRPTGGFIGTYGIMSANGGHLSLDRYDSIESWYTAHHNAAVPESQAPPIFQLVGSDQTLANVNSSPDWPADAQLAEQLWQEGGEAPVDGVIGITPAFLARLVNVLGPVSVPAYGETVTGANLISRVDYWTHVETNFPQPGGRKEFVAALSQAVFQRLLTAPASQWEPLAAAGAAGFSAGEAMMSSDDSSLSGPLAAHGWDDAFPPKAATAGDYFFESEFETTAKNGSSLRRTFTHDVTIRPDGSGLVSTSTAIHDTAPASAGNFGSKAYIEAYGPAGSKLAPGSDAPFYPADTGWGSHPDDNWYTGAPPLGSVTLKSAFDDPHLLTHVSGNRWTYHLDFQRVTAHDGDTLDLAFQLAAGWRWDGAAPPATVPLDKDFVGTWTLLAP